MAPKKRARRPEGARHRARHSQQPAHHATAPNGDGSSDYPVSANGDCPVCGSRKLNVRKKPTGRGWWVQCWVCDDGPDYLRALAEHAGCRPYELLDDPLTHLEAWLYAPRVAADSASVLPTSAHVDGWAARLCSTAHALDYLEARGIRQPTIERFRIGWDGDAEAYTLPLYSDGELVNLLRRRLGSHPFMGMKGRASGLLPDPLGGNVILLAGIFDVLSAQQEGLAFAVTTTCGAKLPDHLVPRLANRRVGVAFDVGEEDKAEHVVRKLRAVGCEAWVVRLGLLGLPEKGDLNDYFCDGGSRREVVNLIRRERRAL